MPRHWADGKASVWRSKTTPHERCSVFFLGSVHAYRSLSAMLESFLEVCRDRPSLLQERWRCGAAAARGGGAGWFLHKAALEPRPDSRTVRPGSTGLAPADRSLPLHRCQPSQAQRRLSNDHPACLGGWTLGSSVGWAPKGFNAKGPSYKEKPMGKVPVGQVTGGYCWAAAWADEAFPVSLR